MQLRVLDREELALALPMADAIDAMREAFALLAQGRVDAPQRLAVRSQTAEGITLLMGAAVETVGLASKTVSIFDGNAQHRLPVVNGLTVIFDPHTGIPKGLCDGAALTAIRTGAVAGAVTADLAVPNARVGALIGTGAQARTQLLAMDRVRKLGLIRVYSQQRRHAAQFVAEMQSEVRAELVPVLSSAAAVSDADIVTTATNSRTPVLSAGDLKPACHINAIGSYRPHMRELDGATLEGAHIYVDSIEAVLEESGELIEAEREGVTSPEQWTEIGQLFLNPGAHRARSGDRTIFKSVGHAVQDVAAMAVAFRNAELQRLGRLIKL